MKKILICGLPTTGKTTFAAELKKRLQHRGKTAAWFNADEIRNLNADWDFTPEGRLRQARRMRDLSDGMMTDFVICDFVAPTEEIRSIFGADYTFWMNTEERSEYEDTNALWEDPSNSDFMITEKNAVEMTKIAVQDILLLK